MQTQFSLLGLTLFCIYLLFYAGFVLLNAFAPEAMESTPVAGLNVAILYGLGLIVTAVVMSMIYGVLCDTDEPAQPVAASRPTAHPTEGQPGGAS